MRSSRNLCILLGISLKTAPELIEKCKISFIPQKYVNVVEIKWTILCIIFNDLNLDVLI